MMQKAWSSIEEVPYNFSGSSIKFQCPTGWKIDDLNPIWVRLLDRSQLSNPSDLPCFIDLHTSPHPPLIAWLECITQNFMLHNSPISQWYLPLSPTGWRGIVVTVRAGSCQTCGTHISATAWRIFSIQSSVELSRPVVVHCHGHCPFAPYGLAHGPKTCQIRQHWGQTLRNPYFWNHCMDLYHLKFYGIV